MGIRLRLPDIKGSDAEQLRQLRSYLYQLVPQLQWALDVLSREGEKSAETVSSAPESIPVSAASFRRTADTRAASSLWTELGLSDAVSAPAKILGRGGAGCRYICQGGKIAVAFSCCAPAALPVTVCAQPLPEACRPNAPVYAICYAEFSCGEKGFAAVGVSPEGEVQILCAQGGEEITAIDGYMEFWTE